MRVVGLALIAAMLAASWFVTVALGGTSRVAPHWFYLPILFSAAWFGSIGTGLISLAAVILAGPMAPADTALSTPQPLSDWLSRGAFFVIIGQAMAWLTATREEAREALGETRRLMATTTQRARDADAETERHERTDAEIAAIIRTRTVDMVYQPIVNLRTGQAVGMEALARFRGEPYRAPNLWFEDAHRVGRGTQLELVAFERAMECSRQLPDGFFISVNLSPSTIAAPGLLDALAALPTRALIIEATEHIRIDNYDSLQPTLAALRELGARLAIDDAGAGFASLRHILRLGPDLIKLDAELTQRIHDDPARRALAAGLIAFAWELGAEVVAEAIETKEDLETLRDLGVSYGQGYYLARPSRLHVVDLGDGATTGLRRSS